MELLSKEGIAYIKSCLLQTFNDKEIYIRRTVGIVMTNFVLKGFYYFSLKKKINIQIFRIKKKVGLKTDLNYLIF